MDGGNAFLLGMLFFGISVFIKLTGQVSITLHEHNHFRRNEVKVYTRKKNPDMVKSAVKYWAFLGCLMFVIGAIQLFSYFF
ncbi:hypothetical protein [Zooshikella sp. RANM57]|uniref:hypothetical protein n=1 Tax=Zooshikella sp. RANM57 TaxID=3425863 RepID=UPI003D6E1179